MTNKKSFNLNTFKNYLSDDFLRIFAKHWPTFLFITFVNIVLYLQIMHVSIFTNPKYTIDIITALLLGALLSAIFTTLNLYGKFKFKIFNLANFIISAGFAGLIFIFGQASILPSLYSVVHSSTYNTYIIITTVALLSFWLFVPVLFNKTRKFVDYFIYATFRFLLLMVLFTIINILIGLLLSFLFEVLRVELNDFTILFFTIPASYIVLPFALKLIPKAEDKIKLNNITIILAKILMFILGGFSFIYAILLFIYSILFLSNIANNYSIAGYIISFLIILLFTFILIDKTLSQKRTAFKKLISIVALLMIALMLYAFGIRINAYGLTPSRIYGVVFGILLAIFYLSTLLNKQFKYTTFYKFSVLTLVLITFLPKLNIINLSVWSQTQRIKNNTPPSRSAIYTIYKYKGPKAIKTYVTAQEYNRILKEGMYVSRYSRTETEIPTLETTLKESNPSFELSIRKQHDYYPELYSLDIAEYNVLFNLPYDYYENRQLEALSRNRNLTLEITRGHSYNNCLKRSAIYLTLNNYNIDIKGPLSNFLKSHLENKCQKDSSVLCKVSHYGNSFKIDLHIYPPDTIIPSETHLLDKVYLDKSGLYFFSELNNEYKIKFIVDSARGCLNKDGSIKEITSINGKLLVKFIK